MGALLGDQYTFLIIREMFQTKDVEKIKRNI